MKSRLFWALKWQRAKRVPFGSKKVFEGTFTLFFKYKKSQRSHKTIEIKVFSYFCFLIEGSGSVQINYGSGCGSRRHKNIWFRILMRMRIRNTGVRVCDYRVALQASSLHFNLTCGPIWTKRTLTSILSLGGSSRRGSSWGHASGSRGTRGGGGGSGGCSGKLASLTDFHANWDMNFNFKLIFAHHSPLLS